MIKKGSCILILFAVISFDSQAQSESVDSSCLINNSLYREYYKQKNYEDALVSWRWTFFNCPKFNRNIYKNGPTIIKSKMKQRQEDKLAYIDTLMLIYDNRIKYFGEEGYVLGKKGSDLILYDKTRYKEAYQILKKSIDIVGNNMGANSLLSYFKASIYMQQNKEIDSSEVINIFSKASDVIEYNFLNNSAKTKQYTQAFNKIKKLFEPYSNCTDLVKLYSTRFNSATEDTNFLKRITTLLSDNECVDSELYFNASIRLFDINPSALSASKMGNMNIVRKRFNDAITYFKQAIELEDNSKLKARYYLELAVAYRLAGSFSAGRNAVFSSLELRPGWGEAYLSLGNIYVAGAQSCGESFEKSTVYWIAVDSFRKALDDENTRERASKSIYTYSKYFPTTVDCFDNSPKYRKKHGKDITEGLEFNIECWINRTTIVRTSD